LEDGHNLFACPPGEILQLIQLSQTANDRLFTNNMFAGFDGGVDLAEMKIGRGTNIDDVDIGSLDRGIEIGEELRDCVFFGESAGAFGIDIANGGNLEEVWGSSKSLDMLCTDTGTDNDDSQGVSHLDRGRRRGTRTALLS